MGLQLSQLTDGYNYLQLYWVLQTGRAAVQLVHRAFSGRSSIDSVASSSPKEHEKLGWFEFRRQPVQSYILASLWSSYVLWTVTSAYFFGGEPTSRFQAVYRLGTEPRLETTDVLGTCIAISLLTIHTSRRLYQSMYVSISSRHRTVNILSLINGMIFHIATGLSVVADGPGLVLQQFGWSDVLSSLRWYQVVAFALFVFGSKMQSDSLHQLAKMRRNKGGHIVTTGYKLPRGGWFDRLKTSSPQFLAEILVHVAIGLSLGLPFGGRSSPFTWWLLTGYVVANHAHLAYDKQLFYRAKFEDLPPERRVLVPYLF